MTIRLTKKRTAILKALQKSHHTMSAAELHAALPDIDLVTIYRSLELFTKEKLVKQFHLDGKEAVYEYQSEPHHHAVCDTCERVIHFTAPDQKIIDLLGIKNFSVDELEVTVRGTCTSQHKPNAA